MLSSGETTGAQLERACHEFKIPLVTICYKDELSLVQPQYGSYIINLDDSTSSTHGTHWVGLYLSLSEAMYFDSFGFPPPVEVIDFLRHSRYSDYLYNCQQIQSLQSGYCGSYVVYFLYHMSHDHGSLESRFEKFRKHLRLI